MQSIDVKPLTVFVITQISYVLESHFNDIRLSFIDLCCGDILFGIRDFHDSTFLCVLMHYFKEMTPKIM